MSSSASPRWSIGRRAAAKPSRPADCRWSRCSPGTTSWGKGVLSRTLARRAVSFAARTRAPGYARRHLAIHGELGLETRRIEILSDSTGETAEKVVRAAMLQFPHSGAHIRLHTRVRTREAVRPILERAASDGALVVFTVVSPELREVIHPSSYALKFESLDLIGSP